MKHVAVVDMPKGTRNEQLCCDILLPFKKLRPIQYTLMINSEVEYRSYVAVVDNFIYRGDFVG
jgi:hypothetical protein